MRDQIHGTTMPVLEIGLDAGESVCAESGELSWMTPSITLATSERGAGGGGIFRAVKRSLSGATLFMTHYTAVDQPGSVAFAAQLPGQIIPVDLTDEAGMGFLAHRRGYLCGESGVNLETAFTQRLGAGIFGGEGFFLQRITGRGRAWVQLSGEVVSYDLPAGYVLRVHPGHVGMFHDSVGFGITTVKGIRNKVFGGDGLFLATLSGPGRVWLQSLTIDRLAHALAPHLLTQTTGSDDSGGVFTTFSGWSDG